MTGGLGILVLGMGGAALFTWYVTIHRSPSNRAAVGATGVLVVFAFWLIVPLIALRSSDAGPMGPRVSQSECAPSDHTAPPADALEWRSSFELRPEDCLAAGLPAPAGPSCMTIVRLPDGVVGRYRLAAGSGCGNAPERYVLVALSRAPGEAAELPGIVGAHRVVRGGWWSVTDGRLLLGGDDLETLDASLDRVAVHEGRFEPPSGWQPEPSGAGHYALYERGGQHLAVLREGRVHSSMPLPVDSYGHLSIERAADGVCVYVPGEAARYLLQGDPPGPSHPAWASLVQSRLDRAAAPLTASALGTLLALSLLLGPLRRRRRLSRLRREAGAVVLREGGHVFVRRDGAEVPIDVDVAWLGFDAPPRMSLRRVPVGADDARTLSEVAIDAVGLFAPQPPESLPAYREPAGVSPGAPIALMPGPVERAHVHLRASLVARLGWISPIFAIIAFTLMQALEALR